MSITRKHLVVVLCCCLGHPYSLWSGTANGRAAHVEPSVGTPLALATADFDGDGRLDFAVATSTGSIAVFIASACGELRLAGTYEINAVPDRLVAGDFDADGRLDVAAGALGGSSLSCLRGDGRGRFAPPREVPLGGRLTALAAGD